MQSSSHPPVWCVHTRQLQKNKQQIGKTLLTLLMTRRLFWTLSLTCQRVWQPLSHDAHLRKYWSNKQEVEFVYHRSTKSSMLLFFLIRPALPLFVLMWATESEVQPLSSSLWPSTNVKMGYFSSDEVRACPWTEKGRESFMLQWCKLYRSEKCDKEW